MNEIGNTLKESKYKQIRNEIRKLILENHLKPGEKLKSESMLANEFGVSTITIKNALAELVNEGYIHRIKGKGTFVCNVQAGTSPARSNRIALLFSTEDYGDSSHMNIIKGAQQAAAEENFSLIVEWSKDIDSEMPIIEKMMAQHVDGMLIYPSNPLKSINNYKYINACGLPFVLLDRYHPSYPTHYVGSDNHGGAAIAAEHLISLGHRKIAFVASNFSLSSEQERYEGFCSALRHAGIALTSNNLIENPIYDDLADKINSREITGLFCCNDRQATQIIQELLARGISIPEQVSIIGFDDWKGSYRLPLRLTTVRQRFGALGTQAANMLFHMIDGKLQSNYMKIFIGVDLIPRETTGKCQ